MSESSEGRISLKIDLAAGTIELNAPSDRFDQALERVQHLAGALELRGGGAGAAAGRHAIMEATSAAETAASTPPPMPQVLNTVRSRSKSVKSSARAGRLGSFEEVRGLLSEEQEIELRAFMAQKAPTEQPDQVLVSLVKGEQLLGRKGLSFNEIYTLMWLSGIKDLPRALDVVMQKLAQDQMVVRESSGYAAKFIGRNRVEHDLPRAGKDA